MDAALRRAKAALSASHAASSASGAGGSSSNAPQPASRLMKRRGFPSRGFHRNCRGHISRMRYSSVTPVRTGRKACASLTCSSTPSHGSPLCFEAYGVKQAAVKITPGRPSRFMVPASAAPSTNGAPIISNGHAVPLPSETFVPSNRQVPG